MLFRRRNRFAARTFVGFGQQGCDRILFGRGSARGGFSGADLTLFRKLVPGVLVFKRIRRIHYTPLVN